MAYRGGNRKVDDKKQSMIQITGWVPLQDSSANIGGR